GVGDVAALVADTAATLELAARYLRQTAEVVAAARRLWRYRASQDGCTPADRAPPPPPPGRRVAVLGAGFGPDRAGAAVPDLHTAALGYAPGDVTQFSYRGGQVDDGSPLAGVAIEPYRPADANGDLRVAAERLRALLVDIRLHHPGVPVDLIGH